MVGVSAKTVKRWSQSLSSGFPRGTKMGGNWFWDEAEVRRWIDEQFKTTRQQWAEAHEEVQG